MPTEIETQLAALRDSAAFASLRGATLSAQDARAFLRITGSDATRWLNGMVTNNIAALAPGEGNYNFLLNAQGRIQGDCTLYREPGDPTSFLLETDAAQLETIHQHLDKFIIMDDVELTPALSDQGSLLLLGPNAKQTLARLDLPGIDPLRLTQADTPHGPVLMLTPSAASVPSFQLRAAAATLSALREMLLAAAIPEASSATLEALRILEGRPKFGQDIRNSETARDLPQETAQTHALHFSKGCYLGQEIVERIHSRGQVHRTFTRFRLTGSLPESLPAPLESNSKPAGELTSAALIGDNIYALGYIRRELLDTHAPLNYPGGAAIPLTGNSPLATGN